MSQYDTVVNTDTAAPIGVHIFLVIFFIITGGIINGFIIYLKIKKPTLQEIDYYIIALAGVDIFLCVIICPQYPLMTYYINQYKQSNTFLLTQYLFSSVVAGFIYLELLTTIALTRLYAVCKPYSFQLSVKRARWIIGIEILIAIIRTVILQFITYIPSGDEIGNIVIMFEIILCFLLVSIAYIIIAAKLYKQKRKVGQNTKVLNNTTGPIASSSGNDESAEQNKDINKAHLKNERALHIKTVKMFGTISLIFAASYIPLICLLSKITDHFHILYLTLFNNNTNFVVYMIFNLDFRKEVAELFRDIF